MAIIVSEEGRAVFVLYTVITRGLTSRHLDQYVNTQGHMQTHGLAFRHLDQYVDTWAKI